MEEFYGPIGARHETDCCCELCVCEKENQRLAIASLLKTAKAKLHAVHEGVPMSVAEITKPTPFAHGDTVRYDGDTWKVLSVGAARDGETYLHLASTTRFVAERNGKRPLQIASFIWPENVTKVQP